LGKGLKEYGAYHARYSVAQWKNSSGVREGGVTKTYGNDSKCLIILVICYFRVGAKMQNEGDGELKSPIR